MADVAKGSVLLTPRFDNLLGAVTEQLEKAFGKSQKTGKQYGGLAGESFGSGFSAKAGAVMGAVSAIVSRAADAVSNSLGAAVSRVDTMANFPKVMRNLGYSTDSAKASIDKMSKAIDGMPTSLDSITGMTQQLAPLCGSLDNATDISIAFNNALLAGGASSADASRAIQQYTQILSKGKPDLQDWKTLQEVMPGQLNQIAKALLGTSANSKDLYSALSDGSVSMDDFIRALVDLNQNGVDGFASFEQQARDATGGIGTAVENVQNRIAKAVAKIIESIGQTNISGAINAFSSSFGTVADSIAGSIESIKGWLSDLYGKLEDNGALKTFGEAWDTLRDAVGKVAQAVMPDWSKMLPASSAADALKGVADALKDISGWVDDHADAVAAGLVSVASALAALKVGSAIAGAVSSLSAFAGAVSAAGGGLTGLFTVLNLSPFALIAAGIAAAAAGLVFFFTQTETGQGIVKAFSDFVTGAWDAICGFFSGLPGAVSGAIATVTGAVAQFASDLAAKAVEVGTGFVDAVAGFFSNLPENIGTALGLVIGTVAGLVVSLAQAAADIGLRFIQAVIGFFQELPGNVSNFLSQVVSDLSGWVTQTSAKAVEAGSQFLSSVGSFFQQLPGNIKWQLDQAVNHAAAFVSSVKEKAREAGQQFLSGVKTGFQSAVDFIGGIPGKVKSVFSDVGSWLLDSGKSLINGFKRGIERGFESAKKAVSSGLSAIRKFFPFSPAKEGPFSGHGYTTYSGRALMGGFAEGIAGAVPDAVSAASTALSGVRDAMTAPPLEFAYARASQARAERMGSALSAPRRGNGGDGAGATLDDVLEALERLCDKDGNVYLDGGKVGAVLYGRSKTALAGRGIA